MSINNLISFSLIFFSIFNVTSCYAASVGDSYGGGTVFCVSKSKILDGITKCDTTECTTVGSGDCGLIMANEDQVNYDSNSKHGIAWASEYETTGAQSLDGGASNTDVIIKSHPKDDSSNNAAWLCHNYRDKVEKHTDWYLPSKNELNKMYLYANANDLIGKGCNGSKVNGVQCLIGGYYNMIYWSSSEYSGHYSFGCAWVQVFSNGLQNDGNKVNKDFFGVRAVRAFYQFNNLSIQQFIKNLDLQLLNEKINTDIHFSGLDFSWSNP